jgi:hypothetical protein
MLSWKSLSELPLSTLEPNLVARSAAIAEAHTKQTEAGTALRTLIGTVAEAHAKQTEASLAQHPILGLIAEAHSKQTEAGLARAIERHVDVTTDVIIVTVVTSGTTYVVLVSTTTEEITLVEAA